MRVTVAVVIINFILCGVGTQFYKVFFFVACQNNIKFKSV